MESRVRWLRIAYWVGAVLDAVAAVYLWIVVLAGGYNPDFAWAAILMTGWTALLIWADRRPLARKGVLPLTVGLLLLRVGYCLWIMAVGRAGLQDTAITVVWTIGICLFFAVIYHRVPAGQTTAV
jgi:hypothetical protein